MKYLLIALLLAGAAWGQEAMNKKSGTSLGVLIVNGGIFEQYGPITPELMEVLVEEGYVYKVDSLADIKPTPAEMED